jgi:hypothetical protein
MKEILKIKSECIKNNFGKKIFCNEDCSHCEHIEHIIDECITLDFDEERLNNGKEREN